jgi:Domain of unknown function (DUF222)
MADPYAETPVLGGTPGQDAIDRDTRSPAQRNHDGLHAALRAVLASGELGAHNGLPASIIVTTSLRELESGAGKALTGGGSLLPMQDVIRPARHAPSLSGDLRQGARDWALSHDTVGFAGAANRVVCQGPWAFAPGLQRVRVLL